MTTISLIDLRELIPAEQLLLDAAIAGKPCNLIAADARPTHAEIAAWHDPDREIRADFLARLVTNRYAEVRLKKVELRGAIIRGELNLSEGVDVIGFRSEYSRYQEVTANGARFTGDASFLGSAFTGDASFFGSKFTGHTAFAEATFSGDAWFAESMFAGEAWFAEAMCAGEAWFSGARFSGKADFSEARFSGDAWFAQATFAGEARFGEAMFAGAARFSESTFTGEAWFAQATFTGVASFSESTFTGEAWFDRATFAGETSFFESAFGKAWFGESTFLGEARFDWATFGNLLLSEAVIGEASFQRATFNGPVDGVWAARIVRFDEALFLEPVTIRLLCPNVSLNSIDSRSRGSFQLRGRIDATAATFGGRTTLADPGTEDWKGWLLSPHEMRFDGDEVPHDAWTALVEDLLPLLAPNFRTAVRELRRATVSDLELSAVDLTECRFDGAHGLDKLRIDSACTLLSTPSVAAFWGLPRFTRRTVIAEEGLWRQKHATWDRGTVVPDRSKVAPDHVTDAERGPEMEGTGSDAVPAPAASGQDESRDLPDAATIAGIYRALRKGREDSGNEPGAADFYYGEMEMRRLARRETKTGDRAQPRAERALLTAYWAVSGYGLRAWRAIAAIVVLILVGSVVFWTVGVQNPPGSTSQVAKVDLGTGQVEYAAGEAARVAVVNSGAGQVEYVRVPTSQVDKVNVGTGEVEYTKVPLPAFTWPDSLEFSARSSVALLRAPAGAPKLTGIGTVTDIGLRLLVPVLLALAVLAIRGRTKR
ncbi:pentapeptide repeat-containing protein [Rhodococcus sp. NPDC059234]|uniref:pentapeptide repeat-containing protein n=1 Tax=Rhodococcus sp. NPDC059234 TaxID=3346781 RepID=UPI00366CE7A0